MRLLAALIPIAAIAAAWGAVVWRDARRCRFAEVTGESE